MSRSKTRWVVACTVFLAFLCAMGSLPRSEPALRIACAANFYETALLLAGQFESETGLAVHVVSGSTGKHVAQIAEGAPYQVLLAADVAGPSVLEDSGLAVAASRWTYAHGVLVAWAPRGGDPRALLTDGQARIAIANPNLAPYGVAAVEVLEHLGASGTRILGENASQALHFTRSGSVDVGLVALAQVPVAARGGVWIIPDSLYSAIAQDGVLLEETEAARSFRRFMQTERVRSLILAAGYTTPSEAS